MELAVDLHIHTALSPCAMDDMTPNNIVNMALLKGLDAIAITDHNSCDNVGAFIEASENRLIVVPGMEVQTREEVHLLCYFEALDRLMDFDVLIRSKLPTMENVPEIFGNQFIMDKEDNILGERSEMLLASVDLSIDRILYEVQRREGVVVPAHIHRPSFSLISQLGFIPDEFSQGLLEVGKSSEDVFPIIPRERFIHSSDAHRLGQILERESLLKVKEASLQGVIRALRQD